MITWLLKSVWKRPRLAKARLCKEESRAHRDESPREKDHGEERDDMHAGCFLLCLLGHTLCRPGKELAQFHVLVFDRGFDL